jgi:hypothetical protein
VNSIGIDEIALWSLRKGYRKVIADAFIELIVCGKPECCCKVGSEVGL